MLRVSCGRLRLSKRHAVRTYAYDSADTTDAMAPERMRASMAGQEHECGHCRSAGPFTVEHWNTGFKSSDEGVREAAQINVAHRRAVN